MPTEAVQRRRASGILLHPVSLPGRYGIGDLGREAHEWVAALATARQSWWQVLPLGPTGYADSPYQSLSSFAGNANLLSPDFLAEDGLINLSELDQIRSESGRVNYAAVIPFKRRLVEQAWGQFQQTGQAKSRAEFDHFRHREASWLDDFALFLALKEAHGGRQWSEWPAEYAFRMPEALAQAAGRHGEAIDLHRFAQFLFFRQWQRLRGAANEHGVRLIGDLPIFVAYDSADVWAHPELFQLDERRQPTAVAGVPPDYFSATGQLWGNPLYDWDALRKSGYAWWVDRLRATLRMVDVVRLDHFRGLQAYWEVPAGAATAQGGRWMPGPGGDLLTTLRNALGGLPLIAEDLGFITPEVDQLRERFGLPGMRILQFAFGGAVETRFLPHNLSRDVVVYTGTHDNDTTVGWFTGLTDSELDYFLRYTPEAQRDPAWALIRLAWASVADRAIAPVQDVLQLDRSARMNRPGTCSDNWQWRLRAGDLTKEHWDRLAEFTETYQRTE
jgi:4-alpha-glucanotransferase